MIPISLFFSFVSRHTLLSPVFVVYADIETRTEEIQDDGQGKSSRKLNELIPFMIAYFIKFSQDEVFEKHPHLKDFETLQIFEGENCIEDFFIKLKEDCYKIKTVVRSVQPLRWNSDLEARFIAESVCGICHHPYTVDQDTHMNWQKIRHHCHVTG